MNFSIKESVQNTKTAHLKSDLPPNKLNVF